MLFLVLYSHIATHSKPQPNQNEVTIRPFATSVIGAVPPMVAQGYVT